VPASFSAHLRELSDADFETVLQRRVEVKMYLGGRWRKDMATLADILAQPHAIRMAVSSLDAFLAQLLRLAVWLGPRVGSADLAAHAPDVPLGSLREGAEELSRWGLAFVDGPTSPAGAGWTLDVPACTMAAVPTPAGFGPLARRLLAKRSIHFLATLSRNIGLATGPRRDKEEMVAEVSAALAEPERIRGLLAEAEPKAAALFDLIQEKGGGVGRRELMSAGHIRWSDPPWSERRKVLTPLDWLESRGLVVHVDSDVYSGAELIPAEISLALQGGRLFDSWQVDPPAPLALRMPGADHPGDPSRVLGDLEAVLDEWAQSRPTCLQRGGLGIRELKKTAKNLGFAERYVSFLYAMAVEAQLVGIDQDNRIVPSPLATEWGEQPPPHRWATLLDIWLGATLWTEEDNGLVPLDKVERMEWLGHIRAAVVGELAGLPAGTGTDVAGLAARIAWRFPSRVGGPDVARMVVERAVEALVWLGTAVGPDPIAVVEPGRSAARQINWFSGDGPGPAAFAAEVATCTVGADLNVIVPGPPVPDLGSALARFADLKASSPARIYKLSEASVRRAMDGGMRAPDIIAVLERHSTTDIPQNVTYLIEDVARRHGNLVVGAAGLYLRSEDPGLLRSAVADRRLASMQPRLIAPTVAVLEGDDIGAVLPVLRAGGYLPVAEAGGASLRRREAGVGGGVHRLLRPSEPMLGFSPAEAAALASVLREAGAAPPGRPAAPEPVVSPGRGAGPKAMRDLQLLDGRTAQRPSEIKDLIEVAVDEQMVVEIVYVSQDGRRTTREIEPLETSRLGVDAWCRLRDDERHFVFSRIQSARATGTRYLDLPVAGGEEESLDLR